MCQNPAKKNTRKKVEDISIIYFEQFSTNNHDGAN